MNQKHKLGFDVLSDRGNQVASQFGLTFSLPQDLRGVYQKFGIDLPRFDGDSSWTLPMPARFVIDRQSKIRSADANPDYGVRPEPEHTLKVVQQLASVSQAV